MENPEKLFNKAISAGGNKVYPIVEEHGWQVGRIKDPSGHHWEIGRPLYKKL